MSKENPQDPSRTEDMTRLHTAPLWGFERPPDRIGPYRILETIGEGGMGTVYLAEQEEPVRRRVALKIIKLGMDTKEVMARFEAERQALALMDHPNIAKVLDAGATEQGRPYFVMEYVTGEPITQYCDRHKLSTKRRLELLVPVCRAIHHAHQKGIIHRDVKPSNVLVTIPDDTPVPKVIDFGVAKATGHRLTERTVFTEQGQLIGTPEYMSPEQAEMTGLNVDTRTDIYSLGVLLYELMTGTLPFEPSTLRAAGLSGIQETIREKEPPRPSTRISRLGEKAAEAAKHRRTSAHALRKQLNHELDWITMRAMEKDRARRYQSASEFAAEIERYLNGEAILASPPSLTYRMSKFVHKHRGPVAAMTAILVTIVVLGTVAFWQGQIAKARANQMRANAILAYAAATTDPLLKTLLVLEVPDLVDENERFSIAREAASARIPTLILPPHASGVLDAAFSPDGARIVSACRDRNIRVWAADGSGEPHILEGHEDRVRGAAFNPDGTKIVSSSVDGTVRVWSADGVGEPLILEGHKDQVNSAVFSPDGTKIVSASNDGTVRVWPADGIGEALVFRDDVWFYEAAFSPDGTRIVAGERDPTVRVSPADGIGEPLVFQGDDLILSVAFSPDGTQIVTGARNGMVQVWAADGAGEPVNLQGHKGMVLGVAFSPDGTRIVSASVDQTARVWPLDGRSEPLTLRGHKASVTSAAFSPDGTKVVTASQDRTAQVWAVDGRGEPQVLRIGLGGSSPVRQIAFSPDGKAFASASPYGVEVWSADGEGKPMVLSGDDALSIAFSPGGAKIVAGFGRGVVRVWPADGRGDPLVLRGHEGNVFSVAFNPDGTKIVTGSSNGRVQVWSADGNGEPMEITGHDDWQSVAFSPDGTKIVTADMELQIRSADGSGEPRILSGHRGWITSLAFNPDGSKIVTASVDHTVRVWPADGVGEPVILRGHRDVVRSAEFSQDGTRIVSASSDQTVRVWPADGSGEPMVLRGYNSFSYGALSPDGSRIVTGSGDGTILMWSRLTWGLLSEYLRSKTDICLTPEQRIRYLDETPSEAWNAYAECESLHGRSPQARSGISP